MQSIWFTLAALAREARAGMNLEVSRANAVGVGAKDSHGTDGTHHSQSPQSQLAAKVSGNSHRSNKDAFVFVNSSRSRSIASSSHITTVVGAAAASLSRQRAVCTAAFNSFMEVLATTSLSPTREDECRSRVSWKTVQSLPDASKMICSVQEVGVFV
jgi:hypothetical protein